MHRRRTLIRGHLVACVGRRWTVVIFCEELIPVFRDMPKSCNSGENKPHYFSRVPFLTFIIRYCGVLVGPHLNCLLPFGSCSSRDTKKIQAKKDGKMYFDCSSLDRGENYPLEKWGVPKGVSFFQGSIARFYISFQGSLHFWILVEDLRNKTLLLEM